MYCSKCGAFVEGNYCTYCGTKLQPANQAVTPEATPAPEKNTAAASYHDNYLQETPQDHLPHQQYSNYPHQNSMPNQPYNNYSPQNSRPNQPYNPIPPQQQAAYHPNQDAPSSAVPPIIINNVNTNTNVNPNLYQPGYQMGGISPKSRWLTFFLCLFFGYFGVHRFYAGKIVTGIIWVLTLGLWGFGWFFDCLVTLFGGFKDGAGLPIKY